MSGYSDYYYFSRVFKQEFGISPKAWLDTQISKSPSGTITRDMSDT